MTTLLLSHHASLAHATPPGHPERPDRLRAIERALIDPAFSGLIREDAPLGEDAHVLLCHPDAHLERLRQMAPTAGLVAVDADTILSPGSLEAALRGVGGAVAGVDAVMSGRVRNAFVATRPPGHHAERATAMGFCFFNQAAIAARHARAQHGASRVAIIDWDVHHGNGTQDIVWDDPALLYISTHEMPLYPGTGAPSERGGHDNVLNLPLAAGDGADMFREAITAGALPKLAAFKPDLIVISAGFDAHRRDPLGNINLDAEDFAWATRRLMEAAPEGRVVSVLEGGYDLQGLASSAAAHVAALMEG